MAAAATASPLSSPASPSPAAVESSSANADRRSSEPTAEQLIRRWRRTGDTQWRGRAIEAYMPLARRLARRFHPGPEPLDDLVQVAYMGLVKAVDRYDPDSGHRFGAYAIPTITGELRRHFRDTTWAVHVPRGMQEQVLLLRRATQALTERAGRAPTVSELCAETGLDAEQVAEALQAQTAREPSSIERPIGGEGDDEAMLLGDTLGGDDDGYDLVEHRASIEPLLNALPARERELLRLRFEEELTQTEIAERFGCSQMHISRVLRRVLDRLGEAERAALRAETAGAGRLPR
jgi:RNA polymerase sigma-B factor